VADPPGTRTEDMQTAIVAMGGSSANIAAGIVKLGGQADLVTSRIGRFHWSLLHQSIAAMALVPYVQTVGGEHRSSLAVYESTIEDHQTVIYRNGAADFALSNDDVEAVDYSAYGALITAGTVFAAEPSRRPPSAPSSLPAKGGPADPVRCRLPALFLAVQGGRFRCAVACSRAKRCDRRQ
jgi:5-dehydro-2-deoxygluconokinase